MGRLNLKTIVNKKDGIISLLNSMSEQTGSAVSIEDASGKILFGDNNTGNHFSYPIIAEEEHIGTVNGNEKAMVIANFLSHVSQKEVEKKRLGSEVLNLYQEINLIFNFSEKLAKTIDAPSICDTTLQQARHIIKSDFGIVILRDENENSLKIISGSQETFFDQKSLKNNTSLLSKIILSGQSEIITETSALINAGILYPNVNSIIYSALKVNDRILGAIMLANIEPVNYTAADLKLLTTLALQSSAAIESALLYDKNLKEAKEREEAMRVIYEATGKFVPYEFIAALGHKLITDIKLGDQVEKIVTVLFSDIRNYTSLSEQMTPEQNFKFVCSFNERMGPAIRKNNGFINQYIGDAIMAIFPGNASDALSAAIEMQNQVETLNVERNLKGEESIHIGVGMHTGPLIMGITGDADRLDATTISDTVNIASRLESLTKHYQTGIILSDDSLQQLKEKDRYQLRHLGIVQLKGKQQSIKIHECFNCNNEEDLNKKKKTLSSFNEGVNNYLNKSFDSAVESFLSVANDHPEDKTAAFFLSQAKDYLKKGAPENWAGAIEMKTK